MLETLETIAWASLAQPASNTADAVPRALRRVAALRSEDEAGAAYHGLLYAVGNDHAGTYYPVVEQVMPFLGEILTEGSDRAREVVLDALTDLLNSFDPESGYEFVEHPAEGRRLLNAVVREEALRLMPVIDKLLDGGGSGERTRLLAGDLLNLLRSGPDSCDGDSNDGDSN